jgi:hypothetical protein
MRVRVDDAREHVQTARLDVVEGLALSRVDDRVEQATRDENIRLADALLGDDASTADREICGGRPRPLRRRSPARPPRA